VVPQRLGGVDRRVQRSPRNQLKQIKSAAAPAWSRQRIPLLGEFLLSCEGEVPLLFTENETNHARIFPGQKNESPYVKDGINDCVVQGNQAAVNAEKQGTKVAAHYRMVVEPASRRPCAASDRRSRHKHPGAAESFGRHLTRPWRNACRRRTRSIAP